ncbi:hypothetical protein TKK_0011103 [Trichogramma kaykai]
MILMTLCYRGDYTLFIEYQLRYSPGLALNRDGSASRKVFRELFEIRDKLADLDIEINKDLFSIMMLYSLPASFENFRCAIETRDELPEADVLKVKILEESQARNSNPDSTSAMAAFFNKHHHRNKNKKFEDNQKVKDKRNKFSNMTCYKCRRKGHIASHCRSKSTIENQSSGRHASVAEDEDDDILRHLCKDKHCFDCLSDTSDNLNLANNGSTNIEGKGVVKLQVITDNQNRSVRLEDALYVPDLRSNLLSVCKIVDKNNTVTFDEKIVFVRSKETNEIKMVADRIGNLWYLRKTASNSAQHVHVNEKLSLLQLWHNRMVHLNEKSLRTTMLKTCGIKL